MKILFVHQNFPAQYRYLASTLTQNKLADVLALGDATAAARRPPVPGVKLIAYECPLPDKSTAHPFVHPFERAVRRGQIVARACRALRAQGYVPDRIYAHPGWGEALFLRDVYPESRITLYCEFFYRATGADVGFDREFPAPTDDALRVRAKNAAALLSLEAADDGTSPTQWQKNSHPDFFRDSIDVIHDGVDTDYFTPGDDALELPQSGTRLTARDEVITYVARNLEPYRGFHTFMRALPRLQATRPNAHVVIVGNEGVSYGNPPPGGKTHREWLERELADRVDATRVHFLGWVPYATLRTVYRISSAHAYLTYPFVLSWSMLEAMSCGCSIVGSDTAPVREIIENRVNGRLVDFFDADAVADALAEASQRTTENARIRQHARETVVERYDLTRKCLPAQLQRLGLPGIKKART